MSPMIRQEQLKELEQVASRRFERAAVDHLRSELTSKVAGLSDLHLLEWTRDVVSRAASFQLLTQRQAMCFLDAEVLLGRRFYEQPSHTWALHVLRSDKLLPQDKAMLLLATACSIQRERDGRAPERV